MVCLSLYLETLLHLEALPQIISFLSDEKASFLYWGLARGAASVKILRWRKLSVSRHQGKRRRKEVLMRAWFFPSVGAHPNKQGEQFTKSERKHQGSSFRLTRNQLIGLLALSLTGACASPPPPQTPVEIRQAHHQKPEQEDETPFPQHWAPPPAYGNKVVQGKERPTQRRAAPPPKLSSSQSLSMTALPHEPSLEEPRVHTPHLQGPRTQKPSTAFPQVAATRDPNQLF